MAFFEFWAHSLHAHNFCSSSKKKPQDTHLHHVSGPQLTMATLCSTSFLTLFGAVASICALGFVQQVPTQPEKLQGWAPGKVHRTPLKTRFPWSEVNRLGHGQGGVAAGCTRDDLICSRSCIELDANGLRLAPTRMRPHPPTGTDPAVSSRRVGGT